jgi:hypothetical protein
LEKLKFDSEEYNFLVAWRAGKTAKLSSLDHDFQRRMEERMKRQEEEERRIREEEQRKKVSQITVPFNHGEKLCTKLRLLKLFQPNTP